MSALQFARYLDGMAAAGAVLGDLTSAPVDILTALVPLVVSEPIEARHFARITPRQVLAAHLAAAQVTDFEYLAELMQPDESSEGEKVPMRVALVAIAEKYRLPVHEVVLWPAVSVLAHFEHARKPKPSEEARAAIAGLNAVGINVT